MLREARPKRQKALFPSRATAGGQFPASKVSVVGRALSVRLFPGLERRLADRDDGLGCLGSRRELHDDRQATWTHAVADNRTGMLTSQTTP